MPKKYLDWTPEKKERLRRLWKENIMSVSEIAFELFGGKQHKNAVCGMAQRMELGFKKRKQDKIQQAIDERFIADYENKKLSVSAIALKWKLSPMQVNQRAFRLGLTIRKKFPLNKNDDKFVRYQQDQERELAEAAKINKPTVKVRKDIICSSPDCHNMAFTFGGLCYHCHDWRRGQCVVDNLTLKN